MQILIQTFIIYTANRTVFKQRLQITKKVAANLKTFDDLSNISIEKYDQFIQDSRPTFKVINTAREINTIASIPDLIIGK